VVEVALEGPEAELVPHLAVAVMGERSRMADVGMVAEGGEEDLKQTNLWGQRTQATRAVVCYCVRQHAVANMRRSFLNTCPLCYEEFVFGLPYWPQIRLRGAESIYLSSRIVNAAKLAMVWFNYQFTSIVLPYNPGHNDQPGHNDHSLK
jgi:hypothetical protein